jgi:hypothetical protein
MRFFKHFFLIERRDKKETKKEKMERRFMGRVR